MTREWTTAEINMGMPEEDFPVHHLLNPKPPRMWSEDFPAEANAMTPGMSADEVRDQTQAANIGGVTVTIDLHDPIWIVDADRGDKQYRYAVRALSRQKAMQLVMSLQHFRVVACESEPLPFVEKA